MKCQKIKRSNSAGFTLIEVLIAFSILIIGIVSVFEIQLQSMRRHEKASELNQVQNMINNDLASIRKEALRWQCQQGACSGEIADHKTPARYETNHCSDADPLAEFPVDNQTITGDNPKIRLTREVSKESNKLKISYFGSAGEQSINTNSTIIPQAMNWCG